MVAQRFSRVPAENVEACGPGSPQSREYGRNPHVSKSAVVWLVCILLTAGIAAAIVSAHENQSSYGPIASVTGAPAIGGADAESDCTLCHQDFANPCDPVPCNLNTPGGGVEILDLPAYYTPGMSIPMRVRLWSDSTLVYPDRRWGFQITAVRQSNGQGSGTWQIPDPDSLEILTGSTPFDTRTYVTHQRPGTRYGLAGPVEWSFTWTPPESDEGPVIFCVAGNAGNGNEEPGAGDFVFTAVDTLPSNAVPTLPLSWGALKRRFH